MARSMSRRLFFIGAFGSVGCRRTVGACVVGGVLHDAQLGDDVADAFGKLLDGFDASARRLFETLVAQKELRLPDESGQRVVDLVADTRGEFDDLFKARFRRRSRFPSPFVLLPHASLAERALLYVFVCHGECLTFLTRGNFRARARPFNAILPLQATEGKSNSVVGG